MNKKLTLTYNTNYFKKNFTVYFKHIKIGTSCVNKLYIIINSNFSTKSSV